MVGVSWQVIRCTHGCSDLPSPLGQGSMAPLPSSPIHFPEHAKTKREGRTPFLHRSLVAGPTQYSPRLETSTVPLLFLEPVN